MKLLKRHILEINEYGDVRDIPDGWVRMPTNYTKKFENRGIPVYRAVVGFVTYCGRHFPMKVKITHLDFIDEIHGLCKETRDNDWWYVKNALQSRKKIAEALYSLNEEAKLQRDIQERAYEAIYGDEPNNIFCDLPEDLRYEKLQKAKRKKKSLYRLKNKVLKKIISEWCIKPSGYHVMAEGEKMDYLEIEGFSFHTQSKTSDVNLGNITDMITVDRRRSIPPNKARKVVEAYLSQRKSVAEVQEVRNEAALVEAA